MWNGWYMQQQQHQHQENKERKYTRELKYERVSVLQKTLTNEYKCTANNYVKNKGNVIINKLKWRTLATQSVFAEWNGIKWNELNWPNARLDDLTLFRIIYLMRWALWIQPTAAITWRWNPVKLTARPIYKLSSFFDAVQKFMSLKLIILQSNLRPGTFRYDQNVIAYLVYLPSGETSI